MTQQAWKHPFSPDDTLSIVTNESMPRRAWNSRWLKRERANIISTGATHS